MVYITLDASHRRWRFVWFDTIVVLLWYGTLVKLCFYWWIGGCGELVILRSLGLAQLADHAGSLFLHSDFFLWTVWHRGAVFSRPLQTDVCHSRSGACPPGHARSWNELSKEVGLCWHAEEWSHVRRCFTLTGRPACPPISDGCIANTLFPGIDYKTLVFLGWLLVSP